MCLCACMCVCMYTCIHVYVCVCLAVLGRGIAFALEDATVNGTHYPASV